MCVCVREKERERENESQQTIILPTQETSIFIPPLPAAPFLFGYAATNCYAADSPQKFPSLCLVMISL